MTQPELGRRLRRGAAAVYRWESGRAVPSVPTLQLVAEVLDVSLVELITDQVA